MKRVYSISLLVVVIACLGSAEAGIPGSQSMSAEGTAMRSEALKARVAAILGVGSGDDPKVKQILETVETAARMDAMGQSEQLAQAEATIAGLRKRLALQNEESDHLVRRLATSESQREQLATTRDTNTASAVIEASKRSDALVATTELMTERNVLREDVDRLRALLQATGLMDNLDLKAENEILRNKVLDLETQLSHLSGIVASKGIKVEYYPPPQTRYLQDQNTKLAQLNQALLERIRALGSPSIKGTP